MARLTFTTSSGQTRTVDAAPEATVMETMRDEGLGEPLALCGGCCSCGTCHVYVDPAFEDRLPLISDDEHLLLGDSGHRRPNSRLSCQIRMTDALDGLKVTIAPPG